MFELTWILGYGIVATTVMTGFLAILNKLNFTNFNFIRALGQAMASGDDQSYESGLGAHFIFGCLFAFFYAFLISLLPNLTPLTIFLTSLGIGCFHSLAFSFFSAVLIYDGNAALAIRKQGGLYALSYLGAHLLYASVLGVLFSIRFPDTNYVLAMFM